MKLVRLSALCAATTAMLLVASLSQANAAERTPFRIKQTIEARFPDPLVAEAITKGEAWVMITVDTGDKLTDALATRYTHRAFANEALHVLRQWRYETVRIDGRPMAVRTEVHFTFEASGCVISISPMTALRDLASFADQPVYIDGVCRAEELDRVPTATHTVTPQHPGKSPNAPVAGGKTVLDFVIDENGYPRMPVLVSAPHEGFANAAADALSQWRFTPPTRNGKPVAVQVRQEFVFPTDS